jgi:tetratricopeptide (TPR) repeat protein
MRLKINHKLFLLLFIILTSCNSDKKQLENLINAIPEANYKQLDKPTAKVIKKAYSEITVYIQSNNISNVFLSSHIAKLAKLYFINKLYQESIDTFEIALTLQPKQFSWHYISGVAAQRLGNIDLAIEHLNNAFRYEPSYIPIQLHLIEIYKLLNNQSLANEKINNILKIDKNNSIALFMKSELLIDNNKPKDALLILNKLIHEYPDANKLYYLKATAQRLENKPKLAAKTLLKAGKRSLIYQDSVIENLQKLTTGAGSHLVLANRARNNGHLDVAQSHLLAALTFEPNNITALHNLGFIAGSLGKHADAIKFLKKAQTLDPNNTDIASDYATALVAVKQYNKAINIYHKILTINPSDKTAIDRLDQINQFIEANKSNN